MLELGQTLGIVEKTYHAKIGRNFNLKGGKISKLPQLEGQLARLSQNLGFKRYVIWNFT